MDRMERKADVDRCFNPMDRWSAKALKAVPPRSLSKVNGHFRSRMNDRWEGGGSALIPANVAPKAPNASWASRNTKVYLVQGQVASCGKNEQCCGA